VAGRRNPGLAFFECGRDARAAVLLVDSPDRIVRREKEEEGSGEISRVIAKEMTAAAEKALQASQWAEAIKKFGKRPETKPGLNAFDKKTIYDFKGLRLRQAEQLEGGGAGLLRRRKANGRILAGRCGEDHARMLFRLERG